MAKMSVQYALRSLALTGENDSDKTYMTGIRAFSGWAKEYGFRKFSDLENADKKSVVQLWEQELEKSGKSPSTIHTYLAPICKGLDIKLDDIEKPQRSVAAMTKGRSAERNLQGKKDLENPKYERLIGFQKCVGLRRKEIEKLKTEDLKISEDGEMYVYVRSGKGGKEQYQAILPEDRDIVRQIMSNPLGERRRVFSHDEMTNKIDLHSMRADHAQRAYSYYADQIQADPHKRVEYVLKLENYFTLMNYEQKDFQRHYKRFKEDILKNDYKYVLRGENAQKAREKGLQTTYDRLALMMVSVFHLAHWRNDVTVINYMIR